MEKHTQNIQNYLSSGGDPKLAIRYKSATLENRAKISYLLSKLKIDDGGSSPVTSEPKSQRDQKTTFQKTEKTKYIGLITQYPEALHSTYYDIDSLWFEFCELKLELNEIPADDEDRAYELQMEILDVMKKFDKHKRVLDYYLEHTRILPTVSKKDFSNLTALQLDQKWRNLDSLICRRKQTIAKMQEDLSSADEQTYRKKEAAVNRKIEQLQEYILDQEKIVELLAD